MFTIGDVLNFKHERLGMSTPAKRYWLGDLGPTDDFGVPYTDEMIDAVTYNGQWANMTPESWKREGKFLKFGTGYGQRYKKQPDGRWLKVEG